jgi:hypothetical protein
MIFKGPGAAPLGTITIVFGAGVCAPSNARIDARMRMRVMITPDRREVTAGAFRAPAAESRD